jgi:hypothetical protein
MDVVVLEKLPASVIRTIINQETRKFIRALEVGYGLSELSKMRENIKYLMELLSRKEKEEANNSNHSS